MVLCASLEDSGELLVSNMLISVKIITTEKDCETDISSVVRASNDELL